MAYIVRTEGFEGPFDLLLHLIARQKVDLWQVSVSRITSDYLTELKRMEELNLGVTTEFLVVAATLIELKAARLLPSSDAEGDEVEALLEERDLLFAHLLQYQAYKHVAGLLAERLDEQSRFVPRLAGPAEFLQALVPDLLAGVRPTDLAQHAARAMTPRQAPMEGEHIAPPPRLSLAETVQDLLGELEKLQETTFRRLLADGALPIEVVVHFLALLELYKRSVIDVEQPEPFGDIAIRWQGRSPVVDALLQGHDVDEYQGSPAAVSAPGASTPPAGERNEHAT